MSKFGFLQSIFIVFIFTILFLFNVADNQIVSAKYFSGNQYFFSGQPSNNYDIYVNAPSCDVCPARDPYCYNSEAVGTTSCGQECDGGTTWSKFEYKDCHQDPFDETGQACVGVYNYSEQVCSTGDKCIAGETGLRAGSCTCGNYGATTYKYCCTTQGNSEACYSSGIAQDPYPPSEGQCPGGFIVDGSRVRNSSCVPIVSCTVDTSNPPNPYPQCGQTGGCTNDYPANHTVSITRNSCTDSTYTYSCQDQGVVPGPCVVPAPNISSFTGASGNGQINCYQPVYKATLNWTGSPLSANDACASGFWVDISQDQSFNTFSNKCVQDTKLLNFTGSPFEDWKNAGSFSFQQGHTYWARIFNGQHSTPVSLTVPPQECIGNVNCTLTSTCDPSTKDCTFNTTYSVNNASIGSYQINLHPNTNTAGQGWVQSSSTSYQYSSSGTYTPYVEVKRTDGSAPTSCSTTVNLNSTWNPLLCSGGIMSGCNVAGEARCTDYGNPAYASSGWTQALQNECNTACTTAGGSDNYCKTPSCMFTSISPSPDTKTQGQWNAITVNTSTNRMVNQTSNGSFLHFYNGGNCSIEQGNCPKTGWTYLTGYSADGNHSTTLSQTTINNLVPASGGTYTFGLADQNGKLYCTGNETFSNSANPPPPGNNPFCSLSVNGTAYPATAYVNYNSVARIEASVTGQGQPWFTLTLPDGTRGTYSGSTTQLFTMSRAGDPGTYSVDLNNTDWGGTCNISQDVVSRTSAADCQERSTVTLTTLAFDDPLYSASTWPAYRWRQDNNNACYQNSSYYGSGVKPCDQNRDCNDNNSCTSEICAGLNSDGEGSGYCSIQPMPARTQCTTINPQCSTWFYRLFHQAECNAPAQRCNGTGQCVSANQSGNKSCRANSDCGDNNTCTNDQCDNIDEDSGQGTCSNQVTVGTSCNASGKNGLCSSVGECNTAACRIKADCNDNNACTEPDRCEGSQAAYCDDDGCYPETLGVCRYTNTPYAVCEGTSSNPTKLCDTASPSQCAIRYATCSTSSNDQSCCGTKNIQGIQCQGTCNRQPYPDWQPRVGFVPNNLPGKAGVVVHVEGSRCNINYNKTTEPDGRLQFILPRTVGRNSSNTTRVDYTVWAEIPAGETFTRGSCYVISGNNDPSGIDLVTLRGVNRVECNRQLSAGGSASLFSSFGYVKIFPAWIQTTGGDVHSNTNISTPGGPQ
ncbi:MAG: hypothetical protein Q7R49_06985 [Candidatus Daviesbacteria bacterium]|nr:hypothetical protein [Candidatus Daviesbacteria bacterium]